MARLRLRKNTKQVGEYAHDKDGNSYGSLEVAHGSRQCQNCRSWRDRGWQQARTEKFWCHQCVTVIDAGQIRHNGGGYLYDDRVTEMATDEEIFSIVDLKDKAAELHNRALELDAQVDNIITAIIKRAEGK